MEQSRVFLGYEKSERGRGADQVVKLVEYDGVINQLTQELGVGDRKSVGNVAAPMSAPETKPFVPTMTEPINRYSQPDDSGSNSDPYAIPENRQTPYTPGVEGGWQEETQPAPYTPGVEGGDIGIDVINDYGENNEIGFGDMAEVLTNIYENPDETEKILYANGYDSLGELKGKMQEDGHLFDYLDLTGKLEGMGYEQPKVGEGAAFVKDPQYDYIWKFISKDEYISKEDYDKQVEELMMQYNERSQESSSLYNYIGNALDRENQAVYREQYDQCISDIQAINKELRSLEGRRDESEEEDEYNASKITLKGDMVTETSALQGEPGEMRTIYLSQDAARLILDPSPVIKLSENTGLSVEDILEIAKGTLDVGAKIVAEVAEISALSAVATWVGVYGINKFLSDTFYAKPKIDQALSNCEEGDYIYIRSAFSMGGGYNSTFGHTDGNEIFPNNYENYKVDYNEGEINGGIM